ncbi:serine hydrolase domain-containing protein [Sphingomonas lenta]|uniref:Serine hydrolase n=1 Tax=Sphingomonas lenta TaxID=1141887 RepID=A0A2A2SCN8_9SPHN|nr:serine hydrolase domain-containing protein [Sphingomonas lenta]PAX07064.1 serine hydrolase [Sphingomonas lenta]
MKIYALTAGAALLAGAAWAGQTASPAPRPQAQAAAQLPATQALFQSYVSTGKMPGIVGAFGAPGRPATFVTAGRIADGANAPAAGPDSLWRIYSMTKPITGMAAMILVEEGKLRLDQPVHEILPAFRNMQVLTDPEKSLASRPAARPITIRHLLTHTAGLGYNIITTGPLKAEYEKRGILPGAVNGLVEAQARQVRPKSLGEFADRVATLPLIADPGTRWSYSIGLDVLGAVVERAGGMPFERFLQTRIFTPLRMTSTYFTVPASETGRFATNYLFAGDNRVPVDPAATSVYLQPPSFPYGGAGLVSSARDYDRFLHMLQNGGTLDGARVMKPETVRLAMSDLLPPGVTFAGIGGGTGGTQGGVRMGYGAGGSVYLEGRPGGPGKGTYGWGGAAGTIAYVDPENRVRGTIMVNYFPAERWPLRQEIPAALAKDLGRR